MSATATTLVDYRMLDFSSLMQPILGFVSSVKEPHQSRVSPSHKTPQVADLTSALYKELPVDTPQHITWSLKQVDWQVAFKEIEDSKIKFHPSFVPTSERAYSLAIHIIHVIKAKFHFITPPAVTPDGEGNLYLEWQNEDKHLSLCFANNTQGSYIYLSDEGGFKAYPLTPENVNKSVMSYLR